MANVLIVFAHPEPRSFNAALLDTVVRGLRAQGDDVRISDLYAMNFNPVATQADFTAPRNPDRIDYYAEQRHAYETGTLAEDIAAEIEKIAWCDLLIFQFPLYWFSVPAILKGWIDRVIVPGFAFGSGKWYERGGLRGKRAMLSFTMAAYPEMMAADGLNGLLDVHLWPLQSGVLAFCGFDVLTPFVATSVPYIEADGRAAILTQLEARVTTLHTETPQRFHRREDFDRRWKMKPEVAPRTVGHYFGQVAGDVVPRFSAG